MTRLTQADIYSLPERLPDLDAFLGRAVGLSLSEIGQAGAGGPRALPVGLDRATVQPASSVGAVRAGAPIRQTRAAVIPISAGLGFIPGFGETVAAVCRYLGLEAAVMSRPDVAGLAQAVEGGYRLVLLADDLRFVCLDLHTGRMADNAVATGRGYAAALYAAGRRQSLGAQHGALGPILVLGLGPVGRAAARWLSEAELDLVVYDVDQARAGQVAKELDAGLVGSVQEGLLKADLVLEATPVPSLIQAGWVRPSTVVSAPGVPLGVTEEAEALLGERLIHEPLAVGVATMLHMAMTPTSST